jgi:hypothetical protein
MSWVVYGPEGNYLGLISAGTLEEANKTCDRQGGAYVEQDHSPPVRSIEHDSAS